MIDFGSDAKHAQAHRAVARAVTTSRAENLAELLRVNGKLVKDTLALAAGLRGARIVSRSVRRESGELTGVPRLYARMPRRDACVHYVEAMTDGTGEGACAASHAGQGMVFPERRLKVFDRKLADRFGFKPGLR